MTTDTVGGVWTFTCELVRALLQQGHSVALVSFGGALTLHQQAWIQATTSTYGTRFLLQECEAPLEWMQDNQHAFDDGVDLLTAMITDFEAELLHANQFCWGALSKLVPCLITAHSDVLTWADACRPHGMAPSAWLSHYFDLVQSGVSCADWVVAPTQWMLAALQQHFEIGCARDVIYNGRSIPHTAHQPARNLRAITAGRMWDEAKGLDIVAASRASMPILIAGETTGHSCEQRPGLRFLGQLCESDLLAQFQDSSVYIAASIYEPFGLAPLEAALCGCAVVARNIPSLREVWGDAALYFSTGLELDEILDACMQRPEFLRTAQARAIQRASTYGARHMADSYLALYRSLLVNRSAASSGQEALQHVA